MKSPPLSITLYPSLSLSLSLPPAELKKERRDFSFPKHVKVLPRRVRSTVCGGNSDHSCSAEQQEKPHSHTHTHTGRGSGCGVDGGSGWVGVC